MNSPDPYESSADKSKSLSWRTIDFFAAGLWCAIPIVLFVGRQVLLPVFDDFGLELPTGTRYLLSFYSTILSAVGSLIVLFAVFTVPTGTTRHRFIWLAGILGILVGVACVVLILVPLLSLWRGLN